jgi:hypothetical protein
MNDYLVPREIAETLGLVRLRKSTSQGLFLLSESDLLGYGIQRSIDEGALVLSNGGIKLDSNNSSVESVGGEPPAENQQSDQEPEPEPEVEDEPEDDPEPESEEETDPEPAVENNENEEEEESV